MITLLRDRVARFLVIPAVSYILGIFHHASGLAVEQQVGFGSAGRMPTLRHPAMRCFDSMPLNLHHTTLGTMDAGPFSTFAA